MKDDDDEKSKRDAAMALVAGGRDNQYEQICDAVEQWLAATKTR